MPPRLSPIRRFLLWWMRHPNSPHVSANFAVEFTGARAYLERINGEEGPRVSVNHLFAAAVGRTFIEFPGANARVLGNTIRRERHVGVAAPVNLLDTATGATRELSMMVLPKVDQLSLRDIAARSRTIVASEREGKVQNPLTRIMMAAATYAPQRVLDRSFDATWSLLSNPLMGPITARALPVTVAISNPGSAFAEIEGLRFRGAAINLPGPGWCVGSLFGLTPVQDEVVVVNGAPAVRPVLPVMFVFDHRLIDGVMAGKVMKRLSGILQDPEAAFGPHGRRAGA